MIIKPHHLQLKILKKALETIAGHFFLAFLVTVFLALVIGLLIFYQYDILMKNKELQTPEVSLRFEKQLYSQILEKWQVRQESFEKAATRQYPDPF